MIDLAVCPSLSDSCTLFKNKNQSMYLPLWWSISAHVFSFLMIFFILTFDAHHWCHTEKWTKQQINCVRIRPASFYSYLYLKATLSGVMGFNSVERKGLDRVMRIHCKRGLIIADIQYILHLCLDLYVRERFTMNDALWKSQWFKIKGI